MRRSFLLLLVLASFAAVVRGQVEVSLEPRHHKLLDNEYVRLLDVHIPPGDTTQVHRHAIPSVFIVLTPVKTGGQVFAEPGKPDFTAGNIWFESFRDTPRIHRVWNDDSVEFHVMDIELPRKAPVANFFVMDPRNSKMLFDTKFVRVYRMVLPSGLHIAMPRSQVPVLIISLSGPGAGSAVNHQPLARKGDYCFLPINSPFAISNEGNADQEFALLYLK